MRTRLEENSAAGPVNWECPHQLGRTIVLVEQNARMALRLAKHAYVMETGKIALHGLAEDLRHDPKIQQTYLGA